jgi:hypothetical protein
VRDFVHTCLFGWNSLHAGKDLSDQPGSGALSPRVRLHREFQNLIVQRGQESGEPNLPYVFGEYR